MDRQLLRPFSPALVHAGATSFTTELSSFFDEDRASDEWTDPSPELDDNWDPRVEHA